MKRNELEKLAIERFLEICDLPESERAAYLEDHCQDPDLRKEVEALLRADGVSGSFLDETRAGQALEAMAAQALGDAAPTQIGPYRVIRKVAQGGMGVIYEAEQETPQRRVALKVLLTTMIDRSVLRRFQQEAQLLGQLQHPGIAQIYDGGFAETPQGRQPFFAMELIDGKRLDEHAREHNLSVNERLELIARVCDGLQHAHQKGIIHRDLKPANILVLTEQTSTGTSVSSGTMIDRVGLPKILDFGIARLTDPDAQLITQQTEVGQLIGTLAYMSPEQLQGDSAALDTRCDVYAVGVMLFELLAERRPHELHGLSVAEAARRIQETVPERLGRIRPALRGDIETIVHKTLEQDRERRYGSAAELAVDIRRYLTNQPIQARPATTLYLASRFAQRNKALVGGIAATFPALVAALVGTGYGLAQAESQREQAVAANEKLQSVVDYQSAMLSSIDVEQMGMQIFETIRAEAAQLVETNPQTGDRLVALDSLLSGLNATTVANRALDQSILSRAVATLETDFGDQPDLRADLRSGLVDIYNNVGLYQEALEQARIHRQTLADSLGPEHPETLTAWLRIAGLLQELQAHEEALDELRELLPIQERILGEAHSETLRTQRYIGHGLLRLSRPEETLVQLRKAAALFTRHAAPTDYDRQQTQLDLADYYSQQRDFASALAEIKPVLAAREEQFGLEAEETLSVMVRVVDVHFALQEFDEALTRIAHVAEARERRLGADHPFTLMARTRFANILTELRRFDEADGVIVDTLTRQRRVLGTDHARTTETLQAAVRLAIRTQRWPQAETYAREALAIAQRTRGTDSVLAFNARADLGYALAFAGKMDESIEQGRLSVEGWIRFVGPTHMRTLAARQALAKRMLVDGRYQDAGPILTDTLATAREHYPDRPIFAGLLGVTTTVLIHTDAAPTAVTHADELRKWCQARTDSAATLARCDLWLARAHFANRDWDQAEEMLAAALERLAGVAQPEPWSIPLTKLYLQLSIQQRTGIALPETIRPLYAAFQTEMGGMRLDERRPIHDEILAAFAALDVAIPTSDNR